VVVLLTVLVLRLCRLPGCLVEQADLDLAAGVLGIGVQDQGADVAADIEDRILE
jgi:hypothetical protein